ncbi:hypothetical protein JH06_3296 [Blastocystis sp. subtype 4]|uniref:hypothetical protein n=1 Tax=Blastocystis sp. subtype 4 TaxID=944170 RepID=UPI0007121C7E|nr:hypothetical protein JH06_3296 [Blastocystis sp. subtype 4]KNB42921.1 hypothetical protein JH06_3296 [Blastocystis sp. subtype 4]|eukprot:XP_014526364.1 hypothetical protein JH06_3296 [Blastocystis sp. subtype 4]
MDICIDGVDKTVSREYAIISYSNEKVMNLNKSYVMEVKGKQGAYRRWLFEMRSVACTMEMQCPY